MQEPATAVLLQRAREPEGLRRMVTVSLVAHGVVIALLAAMPEAWQARRADDPGPIMTISLGGAPGPRAGGMTPIGGRPIQQVAPLPQTRRPEPIRPPAAKAPEMTMPAPNARPRPTPARQAPEEARGRTPTMGSEVREGSTVAETGGRGLGFGLSTGGGGTGGYLEVGDFCCPEYLSTMLDLIRQRWNSSQQVTGETMVKFTIQRDGRITDVEVERSSRFFALDTAAQRAVLLTRLPPLPAPFTEPQLTVHLNFQYQR